MKFIKKSRSYLVGLKKNIKIDFLGFLNLRKNEAITLKCSSSKNDICKKGWGFYLTGSTNRRLKNEGLKAGLMVNSSGDKYLVLVNKRKLKEFRSYCKNEKQSVITWFDTK